MERENDYLKEYIKLEALCETKCNTSWESNYDTINKFIEMNFWEWKDRKNYISFSELREEMGFAIDIGNKARHLTATAIDMNMYFSFCEMIVTLMAAFENRIDPALKVVRNAMIETMIATIEKAGFEFRQFDREIRIVEKNAVATEIADFIPELADTIIEYNHYMLKGNLERKRILLKYISDALEPKRGILNGICKRNTDDFFELINTMNVRHNNLDPTDKRKYNDKFATMKPSEQEAWYDLLYEQALGLFVAIEQQERNRKIDEYKQS